MDTLPKLLYLFQMVPITVPKCFFTSLHSMSIRFVWHRNLSRIRYTLLTYPNPHGGVGLQDFELYHKVVLLARVLEWSPLYQALHYGGTRPVSIQLTALLWGHG